MASKMSGSGYMLFMNEYRRSHGTTALADQAWGGLSRAQKDEYKVRAKSAKETASRPHVSVQSVPHHIKPQYPQMDISIAFRSDEAFAVERADARNFIVESDFHWRYDKSDLSALSAELSERKWFFVSCENVGFQESYLVYPTVELAIVQFSFRNGICLRQNFYIIPRTDTIEDPQKAKSVAARTNKLFPTPIPFIRDRFQMKFYDTNVGSSELWSELIKLVVAENVDAPGAMYCLASEYYSIQSAFYQLKADALKESKLPPEDFKTPGPQTIKCVEDLLQATLEYVDKRKRASDANYLPKAAAATRSFDEQLAENQYEDCACDFHAALSSSHCALARATAACWAFLTVLHEKDLFVTSLPLRKRQHQPPTIEQQQTESSRQPSLTRTAFEASASFGRGRPLRNEASGFSGVPFGDRNPRAVNVGASNAAAADHSSGPSAFSSGVGSSPSYHQAATGASLPADFIRKLEAASVGASKVKIQKWNPSDGSVTTREVDYVPRKSR